MENNKSFGFVPKMRNLSEYFETVIVHLDNFIAESETIQNVPKKSFANDEINCKTHSDTFLNIVEKSSSLLRSLWIEVQGCELSIAEKNGLFSQIMKLIKKMTKLYKKGEISSDNTITSTIDTSHTTSQLFSLLLPILSFPNIPLDLRNSCGLLTIQIYLIKNCIDSFDVIKVFDKQDNFRDINEIGQLALFHGILCCFTVEQLFESILYENNDVASSILTIIFKFINTSNDSNLILLSSRILNHITLRLNDYILEHKEKTISIPATFLDKYSIQSSLCSQIQDMIWLLWDHFLDSAKHLARETFIIFIKFQQSLDLKQAISYFTDIGLLLLSEIPQRKYAFNALSFLVPLIGAHILLAADVDLPTKLVKLLDDPTYATHSANLLESLFIKHKQETSSVDWIQIWFTVFFNNFSKDMLLYGFESLLEKLLGSNLVLLALDTLTCTSDMSVNYFCLLIMTLKYGIKLSLKSNKYSTDATLFVWKGIIPFNYLLTALNSFDPTVRILSFNLLNDSSKSTELYHQQELDAILCYIEKNICNQDAAFRQKFITCIKKMLNRINKGMATRAKQKKIQRSSFDERVFIIHEEFMKKLFNKLVDNLYCGANFQRRYTSLLILDLIIDIAMNAHGKPPGSFIGLTSKFYDSHFRDTLLVCHGDSYEIIKKISCKLLNSVAQASKLCVDFSIIGDSLLETVWNLSSSPRPLDSLTSSYLINSLLLGLDSHISFEKDMASTSNNFSFAVCNHVVEKLKKEALVAEKSLLKAVSSAPMYGLILVLRNLILNINLNLKSDQKLWSHLLTNIISTCFHISKLVSNIVKNASPEGQLPEYFNSENIDLIKAINNSIGTQELGFKELECGGILSLDAFSKAQAIIAQMLLLCGWRSIKEISLMFGFIIQRFASQKLSTNVITEKQIEVIGNFFITQLMETKHRGAFEQAYSGFLMVCETLWQSVDIKLNSLPEKWLKHTLDTIAEDNDNRLCATRRSAGVPFIVQAILSTEPCLRSGLSLKSTVETLLSLGSNDINVESKLHSMNILRALYKDTHLGDSIMPYVAPGVQIAIKGYNNGSWNVQNSATLLFSSLVTRMLGVKRSHDDLHNKNKISALIFFKRYPQLYDFFLENMKINIVEMSSGKFAHSAYPILLILARFAPASSEGLSTSIPLGPFIPLVLDFCSSSMYQLRVLAAKALIPLLTPPDLLSTVSQLCQRISLKNQNQTHGNLLFLQQILKTYSTVLLNSDKNLQSIIENLGSIIWIVTGANPCFFTIATALDLFSTADVFSVLLPSHLKYLTTSCFTLMLNLGKDDLNEPGALLALKMATKLCLKINMLHFNEKNMSVLLNFMESSSMETQTEIFNHLLTMNEIPFTLLKKIIESIMKNNLGVNSNKYQLTFVCSQLKKKNIEDGLFTLMEINNILDVIMEKWNYEYQEDYLISMIQASAEIIKYVKKVNCDDIEHSILHWAEEVTSFSSVENSSKLRTSATEALSNVLGIWCSNSSTLEKAELLILKAVLELFTDDDPNIRNTISHGTHLYLQKHRAIFEAPLSSFENTNSLSLHDTLNYLFIYLANGNTNYLSLLIQHSLREDQIEEFGLAQEDDRAFEKGETKVYREDIQISKDCAKAIIATIPIDLMGTLNFNIDMISEYLLLPIPELLVRSKCERKEKMDENFRSCNTITFLKVLKGEIEYVLNEFSIMKSKDIFSFTHFDIWISRLACRALIWFAFKEFAKKSYIAIDDICIDNIKASLMTPRILVNILEWLL